MKRLVFIALVLVVAALAALQSGGASLVALPRSSADRPDDFQGPQLHAIYAVPSDGADRGFDTDGSIEGSTQAYQTWLAGQTGGSTLRFDTFQASLDVTFARLPRTDSEYASRGLASRDLLEQDLRAAGLVTSRKVYIVYFDSSNSLACGGAAWPPTLAGTVAAFYLRGQVGASPPCLSSGFAAPGGPPRYTEFAVLHEVLHPMGIVGSCAPHHTISGHVNESPNDLMYAGSAPWTPSALDIGRDDYYGAGISGCPDLRTVGFLRSAGEFTLTVKKTGTGTVTSDPWTVITCGSDCSAPYPSGTVVRLRASASGAFSFVRWSGACAGSGECVVTMSASKTVTAVFTKPAPRTCRVPRVVGRSLRVGRTAIRRAGCAVGRIRQARSNRVKGRILRQSPRAGKRVRRGTRVNLTVSRGRR